MKLYTDEQIELAKNVDIADMLMKDGEKVKRVGRIYRWDKHDSMSIYHNLWYQHSCEQGGNTISFVRKFYNLNFREAMEKLINDGPGGVYSQASKKEEPRPVFKMPQFSKNMRRTFAYLIKERKIDADIVQYFVRQKKILETLEYHNCAFAGYDENGVMKSCQLKSTNSNYKFQQDIEGNIKAFNFCHYGTSNKLYAFEAAIDMMSFICLHKENWQEHTYVNLGGVAIDALLRALEQNPQIELSYLCLDNDGPGRKAILRIVQDLDEMGRAWDVMLPTLKDWNEDLKAERKIETNFEQSM